MVVNDCGLVPVKGMVCGVYSLLWLRLFVLFISVHGGFTCLAYALGQSLQGVWQTTPDPCSGDVKSPHVPRFCTVCGLA